MKKKKLKIYYEGKADNMEKIAIISVYYGKLPDYFDLWLLSCKYNPTIDFFIVTDNEIYDLPENVKKLDFSFEDLRSLISKKLECPCVLDTPYKLCDYRPMYGVIFSEYLIGYDYWGNCDMDMIFGNLKKFFEKYNLSQYERFLHLGHLSLYRNTEKSNHYFQLSGSNLNWKNVISTNSSCLFDEWNGIYGIYKKNNITMFDKRIFADISMMYKRFRLALDDINYDYQVFYWENGGVYRTYWNGENCETDEFIYIHFKRRKMERNDFDAKSVNAFFIGPEGFTEKKLKNINKDDVSKYNFYPGAYEEERELKRFSAAEKKQRRKKRIIKLLNRFGFKG